MSKLSRVFTPLFYGAIVLLLAVMPAYSAWEKEGNGYRLTVKGGVVSCSERGEITLCPDGQPNVVWSYFLWHSGWQYETLTAGTVDRIAVLANGALCLQGTWGLRNPQHAVCAPRYTLTVDAHANGDGIVSVLQLEKRGSLELTDGLWANVSTRKTADDTRQLFLYPGRLVGIQDTAAGVFKTAYIGQVNGASVAIQGDPVGALRTHQNKQQVGYELRCSRWTDIESRGAVTSIVRFAAMPLASLPRYSDRSPLAIGAITAPKVVSQYEKCELTVDLRGTWNNPFDPDEVCVDADVVPARGLRYRMPGFYMLPHRCEMVGIQDFWLQEGSGAWKIRLTAEAVGEMQITVVARDKTGSVVSKPCVVRVTPGTRKGFVRASPKDPRYLAFDAGDGYLPIGHNVPIFHANNGMSVKEILEIMVAHGENWNRWWMSKSGLGLEWEPQLGWYRQAEAAKIDWLLDDAERLGMYYMMCMDTHQDFREEGWSQNPFNVSKGGMCKTAGEWFTHPQAKAYYRKRLRYTLARWGYSPHVMCWEFGNEFEGWAQAKQDDILAWHREMAAYWSQQDPYRHLLSTSWWGKTGPQACWDIPALTLVQTHSYANNDADVSIENQAYCQTQRMLNAKPHLFAEFGIRSHNFKADLDPQGWGIHHANWSALMSGACGNAMPWWHENYIQPNNLYVHFQALRNYVQGVPFGSVQWEPLSCRVPGPFQVKLDKPGDIRIATMDGFRRAATNHFEIRADGSVSDAREVLALLHGAGHASLQNHPSFHVVYPQQGTFTIRVGRVSKRGHLAVFLDDTMICARAFPCGEKRGKTWRYSEKWNLWESVYDEDVVVTIPAGKHVLRVENQGDDWMRIESYTFSGCQTTVQSSVRVYGLKSDCVILAWLQNAESTWFNHAQRHQPIRPFPGGNIVFEAIPDGDYRVEWWQTWDGRLEKTEVIRAHHQTLTLPVTPIATDLAVRVWPLNK